MGKPKLRECIYCGQIAKSTKDHVIPISLFENPYPPNLITVPACETCNNEVKSADDSYLRDLLNVDIFGSQRPNAKTGFEKTLNSDRQGKSVIARLVRENVKIEPLYTKGGVYLGDHPAFPVDEERVKKIFERIARGLYFDARRKRIPDNYVVEIARFYPWDIGTVWKYSENLHPNTRGLGNVFQCSFLHTEEDEFTSYWLMLFYGIVLFSVSITHPALMDV